MEGVTAVTVRMSPAGPPPPRPPPALQIDRGQPAPGPQAQESSRQARSSAEQAQVGQNVDVRA